MTLTCKNKDRDEFGRKDDEAGPGVTFEALPDKHFVVVDDGVLNVVLEHRVPYFIRALLVFKLGAVTTNEDNRMLPRELLL